MSARKRPAERRIAATVDSVSEGVAVLDTPEGAVRIPAALLPEGAKEGTRLTIALRVDPDATAAAKEEIREIRRRMTEGRGTGGDDVTEL